MSKRLYLLCLGIAAVGLGLAFTNWVLSLRPGATEAHLTQVRAGMTLSEVEALLGGPGVRVCRAANSASRSEDYYWEGDEGRAWISLGSDGRVEAARWTSFGRARPSPLDRFLAWLGS
jgi:hypothetical protein